MKKLDGKICDECRTMFYPGDHINELCDKCANIVWCVFNIYEDGSKELSSIHHTEEKADNHMNWEFIQKMNLNFENKIVKQEKCEWYVL